MNHELEDRMQKAYNETKSLIEELKVFPSLPGRQRPHQLSNCIGNLESSIERIINNSPYFSVEDIVELAELSIQYSKEYIREQRSYLNNLDRLKNYYIVNNLIDSKYLY